MLPFAMVLIASMPTFESDAQAAWTWASIRPDPAVSDAKAAWAWASVPTVECKCGQACDCGHGAACHCTQADCYEQARVKSIAQNKPLVVFVGQPCRAVPGALAVRYDEMPGVRTPSVIVGRPDKGTVFKVTELYGKPGDSAIATASKGKPPG